MPYAAYGNPQTLNLYGYVGNNPITDTDATGHAGDSPPAQFPIYGAEPLDVTDGDNAHWEPQVDVDPVLLNGNGHHGGESALDNELDSLDSLADAAVGDTKAIAVAPSTSQLQMEASSFLPSNLPEGMGQSHAPDCYCQNAPTGGINPNYKIPTFDLVLKKVSDFSAGAGDFLTFGETEKFRQRHGYDNVVDKNSGAYFGGQMTGLGITAAGGALGAAKLTAGLETKIAIHGAEHTFSLIGSVPHLQIMWWIAGAARQMMGSPIRIPLAPWWP